MFENIIALLQQNHPGARKDGLKHLAATLALTVTTEEEAAQVVGKLTADNVNKFITDWRKDADAEIAKATRTRETSLREKYDFIDKQAEPDPDDPPKGPTPTGGLKAEDIQKLIVDSIKEATQGLQNEIATLKGSAVSATRREQLLEVFNDQTPKPYKDTILDAFDNRRFETEEAFTDYLTKTKENVASLTQELADKGLGSHERPILGKPNKDGVSSGVESYITEKAKEDAGEAGLGGKKLI